MRPKEEIQACCWITKESSDSYFYIIQISFEDKENIRKTLERELGDWFLSATGQDFKKRKVIHIYRKKFLTKQNWNSIKKSFSFEIQST